MTATYDSIATTTLGSAASTITFSSISSAYTDLILTIVAFNSGDYMRFRFNGDTGANYSRTAILGDGASASSYRVTAQTSGAVNGNNTPSTTIPIFSNINIFSYAGSTNKTCLVDTSLDRNGSGDVERLVNLWRNTSAITSITLFNNSGGNFAIGTTATLYGIKAE